MRDQLLAARIDRLDAVLLTHEHADQCHGIDDLRALVIRHRAACRSTWTATTAAIIGERFGYCFEGAGGYPAILDKKVDLEAGQAIRIEGAGGPVRYLAAALRTMAGSRRSASGSEPLPIATMSSGCRRRPWTGWAASTRSLSTRCATPPIQPMRASHEALGWIDRLKPRRAVLTNLHVDLDYQKLRAELPAGVEPAYDGLELEITPNA